MSQQWTIDTLAHTLPASELRQRFWREINLAPVEELPSVLQRWVDFAERWQADKPRLDAIQAYIREHGDVPPEYQPAEQDIADSDAFIAQLEADTARRRPGSDAA